METPLMVCRLLQGDCRTVLQSLPDASVHCCITSPPYFGLRDYLTSEWSGGDPACDHVVGEIRTGLGMAALGEKYRGGGKKASEPKPLFAKGECPKCGALRVDQQIGQEETPEAYVAQLVAVFREVWRVLRDDGVVWLNLGSSYAAKLIESEAYIIRRDMTQDARIKIAKAMSSVWSGYASAEQALQSLSHIEDCSPRELSTEIMPEVRNSIHGSQGPAKGDILLGLVREIGQPDAKEVDPDRSMHSMREACEEVSSGHEKENDLQNVLLDSLLVSAQPAGQPLFVGRRAEREDESERDEVAASGHKERSSPLPVMLLRPQAGGASHPPVPELPREAVGDIKRDNTMPRMSSENRTQRTGIRQTPGGNSERPYDLLERITFDKLSIPSGFGRFCEPGSVIKAKDDLCVPQAVAIALRADGWYLRAPMPWVRRNVMPESATDRPGSAVEYVFMLTKSGDTTYWTHRDKPGVRKQPEPDYRWVHRTTSEELDQMPADWETHERVRKAWRRINLWASHDYFYDHEAVRRVGAIPAGTRAAKGSNVRSELKDVNGRPPEYWGYNGTRNFRNSDLFYDSLDPPYGLISDADGTPLALDVNTAVFSESHFATFPPHLVTPLIKCATSEKGCCPHCAAPWVRLTQTERSFQSGSGRAGNMPDGKNGASMQGGGATLDVRRGPVLSTTTTGWVRTCACPPHKAVPAVVLDPFAGAGTTLLVADRLGRDAIGIELNESYVAMARNRVTRDAPLFAKVE